MPHRVMIRLQLPKGIEEMGRIESTEEIKRIESTEKVKRIESTEEMERIESTEEMESVTSCLSCHIKGTKGIIKYKNITT